MFQSILGMINYLTRFIPHYSDKMEPLQQLLRRDAIFKMDTNMVDVLNSIKHAVCETRTLGMYDLTKDLTLKGDASQKGLGACLLQDDVPISFASKSLAQTKQTTQT